MQHLALDQLEDVVDEINKPTVFVFSESWCPDCVSAAPIIESTAEQYSDLSVYKVNVGDKSYWKSTNHELRTHPLWKLSSIPTIITTDGRKVLCKVEEGDCLDRTKVDTCFNQ
ncbi:hypothetical protein GEMRC1_004910 [Eukaryota sp. GEM-RC1]